MMAAAHVTRPGIVAVLLAGMLLAGVGPVASAAQPPREDRPRATLDGKPIQLADAADYFCHDFAFPEIRCFSTAASRMAPSFVFRTSARPVWS